jgi:hypothetical protein
MVVVFDYVGVIDDIDFCAGLAQHTFFSHINHVQNTSFVG